MTDWKKLAEAAADRLLKIQTALRDGKNTEAWWLAIQPETNEAINRIRHADLFASATDEGGAK